MRRYHQERAIIRRHHRDLLLTQRPAEKHNPDQIPAGCFRKRHAPPFHAQRSSPFRNRQQFQAEKALREGVQEVWHQKLSES